jgi:hypothetical protein
LVKENERVKMPAGISSTLVVFLLVAGASIPAPVSKVGRIDRASEIPVSGTVPFVLDGNRIYARVVLTRQDGTLRRTLAYVDSGSPSTILSRELLKELSPDKKTPLHLLIGQMPVTIESNTVQGDSWFPQSLGDNGKVEMLLPAGVLRNYQVVIDYAGRTLTLARPGTLHPDGITVPIHLDEKTGLAAVDATINQTSYALTIDVGSAYSWIRKSTAQTWLKAHPEWQRGIGAVGPSNMRMEDDGTEADGILIRIHNTRLGSVLVDGIGALAIGQNDKQWDFIDWYAKKNAVPVIGWLGGNVLQGFRITIDYPNHMSYWLRQSDLDSHDLDVVGLTLAHREGEYFVAKVAERNGAATVEGIRAGDRLLQIEAMKTENATSGEIFDAMHGRPGDVRKLVVERDGKIFNVETHVTRF